MRFALVVLCALLLSALPLTAETNLLPQDHYRNGLADFAKKDFTSATREFMAALRSEDANILAYYYLGLTYRNLQEYDRALFTLRRLLELNTGNPGLTAETCAEMGRIYNLTGNPRQAVNILLHALKNGSKTPSILNELAKSYMYIRNYRNSKKALDISLSIEPDNAFTYNLLGLLYLELRRYSPAEISFETAIAFKADVPLFHSNLALSLERQQRYDEALKNYRKAASLSPAAPEFAAAVKRVQKLAGKK